MFCPFLLADGPDTWANVSTFVALKPGSGGVGALQAGDVLLAINGTPVDGDTAKADALLQAAAADPSSGTYALVKRGPFKPEAKPKFDAATKAMSMVPFSADCGGGDVYSMGPSGWWSVSAVPLPPEACKPGGLPIESREYSVGGWPKVGYAVDTLLGKFAASAGCWMLECMRGEFIPVSTEDDPTGDEMGFSGCKVYSDVWMVGGHQGGVIVPCLCFPFPICYSYTRVRGGNRFDPKCSFLPCYGPWVMTAHGCFCTESGTFTDADTFVSNNGCCKFCDSCGTMTRRG